MRTDKSSFCLKCLEKDPRRHYATARELAEELTRYLNDEPIQARPLTIAGRSWRFCRRYPLASTLALALFLSLTIGLMEVGWQWYRAEGEAAQNRRLLYFADMMIAVQIWLGSLLLLRSLAIRTAAEPKGFPRIRLWDSSTGDFIEDMAGLTGALLCIGYSADGKWLASGGQNELVIWDVRAKSVCHRLAGEHYGFHSVSFSPDSRLLAARSWLTRNVVICDVPAKRLVTVIPFGAAVLSVAFSPDGERIAIAGRTDAVEVWDANGGGQQQRLRGNGSWLTSIDYSPDGQTLVAASPAGELRFWRAATGEPTGSLAVDRGIRRAIFAPDGNGLVWASMDGTVEYWSATPADEIAEFGGHLDVHGAR